MLDALSSPWIPAALLLLLAGAARAMRGSWLSPAALVALIWTAYVDGCLLFTDYEIFPAGIWIIVLFVFSVQFGTLLAEGVREDPVSVAFSQASYESSGKTWSDRSFACTVLFSILATAGASHLLMYSLEKFSLGFSFAELLTLGHFWSVARYDNAEVEPWSVRLLIMWIYPAALLAGVCFATAQSSVRKCLSFAPFVPAFLVGSLFAVRAGLAFSLVCWVSGFFAIRYLESQGTYALFQRKVVVTMLTMVVCGLLFFVAIDTLRSFEGSNVEEARVDFPRISKYFFGAVPAFCGWVRYNHSSEVALGGYTFSGVFDLLRIKHREIGLYQDMLTLAGGEETNIYTLFRGLIEDFTLPGMCIFGVILGLLGGLASQLRTRRLLWPVLVLAGYYAVVLFSPLTSLFTYNGLILAWVVAALVLGWRSYPRTSASPTIADECCK